MKPAEKIERLIKKSRYKASTEAYDKALGSFLQAVDAHEKQKPALTEPNIWRIIMKSRITKLAAAAVIIGVFGFYLFFGNGQATLYAQVMEAFEQAKTIYAVGYSFEDGQMKKANELWYQEGLGLRTEEIHHGRTHTSLDNGQYEWEYLQGNDFAVQKESTRKMRLPGEITEPSRYLKKCTRDPGGDMEVDGSPCRLYTHTHPGDGERTAVKSMMWIDEQMRFRQYEEQKFVDGVWQKIELATISYDIPIEPKLFTVDFGPEIEVIKPKGLIKNLFPLEEAIAAKEVMGLVFAVHELKRNGNYIFTTCSLRPTDDTRDQLQNYQPLDDKRDFKHYGDIYLTSWWERKKNGDLEERPYAHTMLGYYQVDDILIRCFASLPKAQWPGVNDGFELSVGISAMGKLRELLIEKGQNRHTQVFRPLFTLPLPAEDTPVDEIATNLYERAKLLAPLKLIRLEPKPSKITNKEFALEIKQKLTGLRPMEELWQSTSSEVTVNIVDENGQPVAGAKIGSDMRSYDGRLYWYYQNGRRDCALSDTDGKVVLKGQQMFGPNASRQSSCILFSVQEDKQLAGLVTITDEDFGKTVTLTMQPACRVYGRFVCPELSDTGNTLNRKVDTYLSFFGGKMVYRVLCHSTDKQSFDALLVPGKYEMNCESPDANRKWIARAGQLLDVPKNKREFDLGEIVLKLEDYK
jgi:hypothetical protein